MRASLRCLAVLVLLACSAPAAASELPLGPRWLSEQRSEVALAPGVDYTRIERGYQTARDVYVVDVARVAGEASGPLALRPGTGVVNGGPRLLRRGREHITAYAERFVWPEDPGFFYGFGVRRNPRTLAGTTRDGRLLLVAVLDALGAREGVNLDGGGSTSLTLGSSLVTRPSDATGERPVGDALLLLPNPR